MILFPPDGFIYETAYEEPALVPLEWTEIPDTDYYEYFIYFGGNGDSGGLRTHGFVFYPSGILEELTHHSYGVQFLWKVRAVHEDGTEGPWSPLQSFYISYPVGTVILCEEAACPAPGAWYEVSRDVQMSDIVGVPPLLILDWISGSCTAGRTPTTMNFEDIYGYHRSARFGGCP